MNGAKVQSPASEVWRLFVAIQLPGEVKSALSEVQRELRELLAGSSVSWTRSDNLHLTLRFLGAVETARVTDLENRLREQVAGSGPLDLLCEQLGCFPGPRRPRVVWTWVHDATERLTMLHHRVDKAVGEFAEKPAERIFVGHVTLARPKQVSRGTADRLARFIEHVGERRFGEWRCNEVELIHSELNPGGSRYTTLAKVGL